MLRMKTICRYFFFFPEMDYLLGKTDVDKYIKKRCEKDRDFKNIYMRSIKKHIERNIIK